MSADIAIIGVACRFPGAAGPAAFWRLLHDAECAVASPSENRIALCPGMPRRRGGYLDDPSVFDAAFFQISAREAAQMDPQQRLLLELAWEAFEDAGCPATSLRHTRAAVYIGSMWRDYEQHLRAGPHTLTGLLPSFLSGRIAHHFGFSGPAITVDTSTSSSLVAVHLACQSLRHGESTLALAGGVNLILAPHGTADLAALDVLSPSGCPRPFDARADGYVRGEGAGALVLRRKEDALRDGDRIYGVIRSTCVNHNAGSLSIASPSSQAQQDLLEDALRQAGLSPSDVTYIEAHGTGTQAGDAAELRALQAVYTDRSRPLCVGSVKGNIGHLEAAAGIAGVVKVCLMLKHRSIPATCGHETGRDGLGSGPVQVPTQRIAWASPAIAGISSFGLTGTNAHLVIEEHQPQPCRSPAQPSGQFVLSAQSEELLRDYAGRLALAAEEWREEDLAALCSVSLHRRTHLRCRRVVAAATIVELRTGLLHIAIGIPATRPAADWIVRFENGEDIGGEAAVEEVSLPMHVNWPPRPWDHRSFWAGRPDQAPPQEVSAILASVLGMEESALPAGRTLLQLGLDSLLALELAGRLKEAFGVAIAPRHLLNGMLLSDLEQMCHDSPEWEQTRL